MPERRMRAGNPLGVAAVAVALAIVAVPLYAALVMGAPRSDAAQLALFLSISGPGSLLLGALLFRLTNGWLGSVRLRLAAAYGAGLLVIMVNVLATSVLMFLSQHDLALLLLLLGFSAVVSLAFGINVAAAITDELADLAKAAGRIAAGDLGTRVHPRGSDEIARLGAAFDEMAGRLQASFERERALEAGRRDLIAAVSHDLRTPLATTRVMVEAITDGVVTEEAEVQRYLHLITGEVQHLSRLIDDLFELSQIESGALVLQLAPTHLPELCRQTLAAYQAPAQDGGVSLEQAADPDVPPVAADAPRLQRVLRNLVDNALHYTPPGGVVRVEVRREPGVARVSVRDSGPGLSPDETERVFERFYRGTRARSRADGAASRPAGAGLGLAIARGLVAAHGGRIWAERQEGGGSVFHFTVPLAT